MNIYYFVVIEALTISFCFIALFVMLNRDMKLQQRHMEYVIFGCVIEDIGSLLELIAQGSTQMMLAGKGVQVIGVCVFMVALVSMTGYLCRIEIPLYFSVTLIVVDCLIIVTHFLNNYSNVFYQNMWLESYNDYQYLAVELGPAGVIFWAICVVMPSVACMIMIFYSALQDANKVRKKEFLRLGIVDLLIFLILFLHGQKIIMPFFNPTMTVASIIFATLTFFRWKDQGIDVVSAAAKTAIDSIAGGVITLNKYQEIIYYNEAAKKVVPEIDKFLGMHIDKIALDIPHLKNGEKAQISYGGRKYYVSLSAIHDDNDVVHGYAIMFNDMTEMFNLMDRLKDEQHRADEASQYKSMFVANISHEIRTPMNAIMGLSDLIIEESRGRKVYDMAVTIKKAANSLLDLVNNVLDISKLESGKMELTETDYSIETLITDVVKVMEIHAAQHGLRLKYNIDETLPCVLHGDDGKIRQCLINLINNAIKFTNEGAVRIEVAGIRRNNKVALTFMVIDTGVGIKEEDLGRVFGEFEQVDKILNKGKEGSGLGLTITKQLIELMGGVIDVSSVYGEGTTFTIRLSQEIVNDTPISEISEIVKDIVEEPKMFKSPDTRCLVVDDNKVNLMVAKGFLSPYEMQIDTATSGLEAIELAKANDYDVIMMDHMMPGMDGVEATEHIRAYYDEKGKYPFIIALTANAFGNIEEMFLKHGFNDFVSKPIEKSMLHEALLRAIPDVKREFTEDVLEAASYTEDELAELFMEGVDVRFALDQRGCSVDDYLELLELYYMEGLSKLEDIKTAFENQDWKNYSILTHGLKSTSINVGANELSEHAKKHEFATKDEASYDLDYVRDDYEALMSEYEAILNEAKRVLDKKKAQDTEPVDEEREEISKERLKEAISDILDLSESFRTKEAAEMIDKLMHYDLPAEVEKALSATRMKYKLYDDDGAEDLLHQLLETFD